MAQASEHGRSYGGRVPSGRVGDSQEMSQRLNDIKKRSRQYLRNHLLQSPTSRKHELSALTQKELQPRIDKRPNDNINS